MAILLYKVKSDGPFCQIFTSQEIKTLFTHLFIKDRTADKWFCRNFQAQKQSKEPVFLPF